MECRPGFLYLALIKNTRSTSTARCLFYFILLLIHKITASKLGCLCNCIIIGTYKEQERLDVCQGTPVRWSKQSSSGPRKDPEGMVEMGLMVTAPWEHPDQKAQLLQELQGPQSGPIFLPVVLAHIPLSPVHHFLLILLLTTTISPSR